MWQRIAFLSSSSSSAAATATVFCTAVAISIAANANTNACVDALSPSQPQRSHLVSGVGKSVADRSSSSSSSSSSSAYETFLERVAIHRSRCVALSSVPPLPREDSRGEEDDDDDAHDAAFSNNAASCTSKALATSSSVAAATKNVSFEAVEMPSRYVSKKHAIFGSLWGDTMIEEYQVYRPVSDNDDGDNVLVLAADVTFGTHVNGHGGIVHGGILGLMFDDAMGWAANEVLAKTKTPPASSERPKMPKIPVTANLSVDFRKPVYEGASVRMEVVLERREGRKLYFGARMLGASDGELYAEATSLYIVLK